MPFVQHDGAARHLPLQGLKQNSNTVAKRKLKAGKLSF